MDETTKSGERVKTKALNDPTHPRVHIQTPPPPIYTPLHERLRRRRDPHHHPIAPHHVPTAPVAQREGQDVVQFDQQGGPLPVGDLFFVVFGWWVVMVAGVRWGGVVG